jgi:phosphoglycerate kinase
MLPLIEKARNISGKRVLVRVDLNIPIGKNSTVDVDEDWRIQAIVPTLCFLKEKGAQIILLSHLGRPKGVDRRLSLRPVAKYMQRRFKIHVRFDNDVKQMKNGDIVMLENLRFHKEEQDGDMNFAKKLSELGDIYVNDAFAVSHRADASVVGIPKFLPSYAGLLLLKEFENLNKVKLKPKKPLVVVIGGAKTETKLPVIEEFLNTADHILLGGSVANTSLHCLGFELGRCAFDPCVLNMKKIFKHKKIVMPLDVVVGGAEGNGAHIVDISIKNKNLVGTRQCVYDIGPRTVRYYTQLIKQAQTLVWNGPLGIFEVSHYAYGTLSIARLIAARSRGRAFGVVGGGETVQALRRTGMQEYVDHISTGGGALLKFLAGEKLPGIEALKKF